MHDAIKWQQGQSVARILIPFTPEDRHRQLPKVSDPIPLCVFPSLSDWSTMTLRKMLIIYVLGNSRESPGQGPRR